MPTPLRTVAIVQARMSSTRLPGKVLEPIAGRPGIVFMCERLKRARRLDAICVATSSDTSDDLLARCVEAMGISLFRGDLDDVLNRFIGAARQERAEVIVRLTGDCPLIDPVLVDRVIEARERGDYDYASNVAPPTYPDGLDIEVMTLAALERAHREAGSASEREHVTTYLREAAGYSRHCHRGLVDLSGLRWTVDYPDDLAFVQQLTAALTIDPIAADLYDFLRAQEASELRNAAHRRNEGLAASLERQSAVAPSAEY